MSSSRCNRLATIAFALLAAPLFVIAQPSEVGAENSISNIDVRPGPSDDHWLLDFDYVYSGDPPGAFFRVLTPPRAGTASADYTSDVSKTRPPSPGRHHIAMALLYPGAGTSDQVIVSIVAPNGAVLGSHRIDKVIEWSSQDQRAFNLAYDMIENGSGNMLREARTTLEGLVTRNPQFDDAYVELARVAMKQSWGPEGLHQAETLLDSALKIRPANVNAKILLGYVYTHQERFDEAERLFVDVAREDPPNVWLWTNWGELLAMQGRAEQAEEKYRAALDREPLATKWSYSARRSAYTLLLGLLEQRNDIDGMDTVHRRRVGEYNAGGCYLAEYARFKLYLRRDVEGAIDLARSGADSTCSAKQSRETLGLASYVKWAESDGAEAEAALNQARVFLPAGPTLLHLLASHVSTLPAAQKLVAGGELVDRKDNAGLTALAIALQRDDLEAAQRLLELGADPETLVTVAEMPVALLPVVEGNLSAIALLRQAGVDYSKLQYRGAKVVDLVKDSGDAELLEALVGRRGRSL